MAESASGLVQVMAMPARASRRDDVRQVNTGLVVHEQVTDDDTGGQGTAHALRTLDHEPSGLAAPLDGRAGHAPR